MKIMHLIVGLEHGGAENALCRLIDAQNRFYPGEFKHVVVSLTDIGFHGKQLLRKDIEVHALGVRSFFDVGKILHLLPLIRRYRPDVFQTWMVHSDLIGGFASRLACDAKVIWGVRTTDYSVESLSTRIIRWLCSKLSYIIPYKIVCAAQASLDASVAAGYSSRKMLVIPNGFDNEALAMSCGKGKAIRAELQIADDDMVIGCMGRFNPAKDHRNFVQAAALLIKRYPSCRFMMVGRGLDSNNNELLEMIENTGAPESFLLLGERADAAECLDAMDIFVSSSCTEGFPNVLGEAMAMQLPCVTTNVGDSEFLLGNSGVVVPPRDHEALASGVSRLLEISCDDRRKLGQMGRERIQQFFSTQAMATQFSNLYRQLVPSTS